MFSKDLYFVSLFLLLLFPLNVSLFFPLSAVLFSVRVFACARVNAIVEFLKFSLEYICFGAGSCAIAYFAVVPYCCSRWHCRYHWLCCCCRFCQFLSIFCLSNVSLLTAGKTYSDKMYRRARALLQSETVSAAKHSLEQKTRKIETAHNMKQHQTEICLQREETAVNVVVTTLLISSCSTLF